jgi:hypothetical protein
VYKHRIISVACCLLIWYIFPFPKAQAEESEKKDSAKPLLQKGLTIYEIDRELDRLKKEDAKITEQIAQTEQNAKKQDQKVQDTRKHAGQVLRAYYMGERDSLWMLLFSMKSFSDALKTFEYLNMIVQNDHRALSDFQQASDDLKALQNRLLASHKQLQQAQQDYAAQRERLVKLQEELDRELAANAQAREVMKQINDLNESWQLQGIPLFKKYFTALSEAMKSLPELVTKNDKQHNYLTLVGFQATFQITDRELNDFLRSKNELFQNLTFRFTKDQLVADGKQDNIAVTIKGTYKLDKEKNVISFHVDELIFNGFTLPDTTARALEKEVDLGFYPKNIASFLEATEVKQEEGKLSIKLKMNW